jgi:hypothetical protein
MAGYERKRLIPYGEKRGAKCISIDINALRAKEKEI